MPMLRYAQMRYLAIILCAWLALFFLTRSILLMSHLHDAAVGPADVLHVYGIGLIYDLSFLTYAALPLMLYLCLCPARLWRQRWHRHIMHALATLSLLAMFFTAAAEWFFWDEFGVRFNFIAVDYLVYSEEVIGNILESYPVYPLLAALALVAIATSAMLRGVIGGVLSAPTLPWRNRLVVLIDTLTLHRFRRKAFWIGSKPCRRRPQRLWRCWVLATEVLRTSVDLPKR